MSDTNDGYKALLRSLSSAPKDINLPEDKLSALKKQIAEEYHIPAELANRLKGETLEEIRADAINMKNTLGIKKAPPVYTRDPSTFNNIEAVKRNNAYRDTLIQLRIMDD